MARNEIIHLLQLMLEMKKKKNLPMKPKKWHRVNGNKKLLLFLFCFLQKVQIVTRDAKGAEHFQKRSKISLKFPKFLETGNRHS